MSQPLSTSAVSSVLCWNGEAWKIGDQIVDGNDAEVVFGMLTTSVQSPSKEKSLQNVIDVFSSIAGPYAFVFYDARHQRVFYGRDALGRRSLVLTRGSHGDFIVSSICDLAAFDQWAEVEANGIYILDLQETLTSLNGLTNDIIHVPHELEKSTVNFPSLLVLAF